MKKRIAAALVCVVMLIGLIPAVAQANTINRLTGRDLSIYEALEAQITEVAAGVRTCTELAVPASAVPMDQEGYSAEELGVSAIVEDEDITQEAADALSQLVTFDLYAILQMLMATHPYEMYWFDKTGQVDVYFGVSAYDEGDGWRACLSEDGALLICLPVAVEYAADDFETDPDKTAAAWVIRATPQEIVDANANRSDYEKLEAYRAALCQMVAYNHAAAEDSTVPYGNPWQPVWVFDNDDDTDVVCEGYAKAFQYLCDLTDFTSDAVRCYTVSGDSNGGGHMWNIVTMDDGANYLVDVTNCDEGMAGADDELFLKGYAAVEEDGTYIFTCNDLYTVTYHYDDEMVLLYTGEELTISATDYTPPARPALEAAAMTLSDGISLHFYVDFDILPSEGAWMTFEWGNVKTAMDEPQLLTSGDYAGDYRFTCPLSAKELSDTVTATLYLDGGETVAKYKYSGDQYLTALIANTGFTSATNKLARAVRTYGAAARYYFLGGENVSVTNVTEVAATYLTPGAALADGDISFYGKSLLAKDTLKLRLYFAAPFQPAVEVKIGGADKAYTIQPAGEGYYAVDISVMPAELTKGFDVRVTGTAIQFSVGVNDYIATALANSTDAALRKLVCAIYHYGVAAQPGTQTETWGPLY